MNKLPKAITSRLKLRQAGDNRTCKKNKTNTQRMKDR